MKINGIFSIVIMAVLIITHGGLAQDQSQGQNMDAMMKAWQAAATPGDAHKKLDTFVGKWEATMKMYMQPGTPMESQLTSEFTWILDGRFLKQESKGAFMGQPMNGFGLTGYDNINKKYVNFWIDNTGTAMYFSEGSVDQTGKVFTWYGKMDEPMTGQHDKNVKYVARIIDKDSFVYEVHDLEIGEPNTKVVDILYKRKK